MLDRLRNYARSGVTKVLFALLIVIFCFWGIGAGMLSRVQPVATVNGNRVLGTEVDREAERMKQTLSQMYGANANQILRNMNLRQEALNQIIEDRLISEEARHIGLGVSDDSLAEKIAQDPHFQDHGQFDPERYQEILQANQMMPSDYESMQRRQMMQEALRQMVDQGVQISDAEARHTYDLKNEKISVAYVEVPYQDFTAKISPTPQQIQDYYKSHPEEFREPERIKIDYIHYDPAALASKITPSDKDIEDYYKSNLKKLYTHPDQVHARHILIEVDEVATPQEKAAAKAKAEGILKQLQQGADFAKLAKEDSQDPSTKLDGGDLGTFGRNQMIKPFEDAVFSMKPGELRLVETKFGFHVVKLEAQVPAHTDKLEEVKPKIIDAIRAATGSRMARQALDEDVSAALAGTKLEDLAKKRGIEIVETPAFARTDAMSVVHDPKLIDAAFKLEANEVRAVPGGGAAPYLVKLISRDPSRVPPLKEVEAKVREAFVRADAESQARGKANQLLHQIKTADDFDKVAKANNLSVHKTDPFARSSDSVPSIGPFPEVTDASGVVAKLPGVIDHVMENKGDSYIFEVVTRTTPSDDDWKSAQKEFTDEFAQQRRAEAWTRFLDALKSRAKISIDPNQFGAQPSS
jgi:peptidyl-prolyl cis-trans isomerase D